VTSIIDAIDDWTQNRYGTTYNTKLYGYCELVKKTAGENNVEQIFSVTVGSVSNREQVSINDRYNFITWIRIPNPITYEGVEGWSFGKSEARVGTLPLKIIIAHKIDLGENVVFDFVNSIPSKFTVPGYQYVFVNDKPAVDTDHESVSSTEFGNISYDKHRLKWNVYAITLTIEFLECVELTP